jgi:hypothetical protein
MPDYNKPRRGKTVTLLNIAGTALRRGGTVHAVDPKRNYANILDEELVQAVSTLSAPCVHCHQPVRREHGGVWCHVFAFDMFGCPGTPEPERAS